MTPFIFTCLMKKFSFMKLKHSIEKQAEVLRLLAIAFMGPLGLDFVNIIEIVFHATVDLKILLGIMSHIIYALIGRLLLIDSFDIIKQEENEYYA